jgi:predicted RNA-binding Zn-ribbon protein involved in translation (DUF1610 family)
MSEMKEKYAEDGPFMDPVVRCDSCQALCMVGALRKHGMCPQCGNARVRKVRTISDVEIADMRGKGVDPDWIALFEPMEDADAK